MQRIDLMNVKAIATFTDDEDAACILISNHYPSMYRDLALAWWRWLHGMEECAPPMRPLAEKPWDKRLRDRKRRWWRRAA